MGVNAREDTACACQCMVTVCALFSVDELEVAAACSLRQYQSLTWPTSSPVAKYGSVGWKARHVNRSGDKNLLNDGSGEAVEVTYALSPPMTTSHDPSDEIPIDVAALVFPIRMRSSGLDVPRSFEAFE